MTLFFYLGARALNHLRARELTMLGHIGFFQAFTTRLALRNPPHTQGDS